MNDDIADLVREASPLNRSQQEAEAWLRTRIEHLRRSKGMKQRFLPAEQQKRLDRIVRLAKKLESIVDEMVEASDPEQWILRANLALQCARIKEAMDRVRDYIGYMKTKRGRPPNAAHISAVVVALSFFKHFSDAKVSNTENSPFQIFCSRLCETALGTPVDWVPAHIIKTVLHEEKRAKRLLPGAK
jgi:hypothetical protein